VHSIAALINTFTPVKGNRMRDVGKNPLTFKASIAKDRKLTFFHNWRQAMTDLTTPRRRSLLKGAAVAAGAGAMSAPMLAIAQTTTTLRFQSTWPAKDIFHEYANDFAKKVNDMAGGKLKIEVLPSGAVVPAFQLLEAVNKGTLDGGHGVVAYHYGKQAALALWGSGPAYGMDPNQHGRRVLPHWTDADPAVGLVQKADCQSGGHERPEVPHCRPVGRHFH
jgi:hypothetical protein